MAKDSGLSHFPIPSSSSRFLINFKRETKKAGETTTAFSYYDASDYKNFSHGGFASIQYNYILILILFF